MLFIMELNQTCFLISIKFEYCFSLIRFTGDNRKEASEKVLLKIHLYTPLKTQLMKNRKRSRVCLNVIGSDNKLSSIQLAQNTFFLQISKIVQNSCSSLGKRR